MCSLRGVPPSHLQRTRTVCFSPCHSPAADQSPPHTGVFSHQQCEGIRNLFGFHGFIFNSLETHSTTGVSLAAPGTDLSLAVYLSPVDTGMGETPGQRKVVDGKIPAPSKAGRTWPASAQRSSATAAAATLNRGLEMPLNLSFPRLDRESWRGVGGRRALRAQETSPTCSPSHTLLLTWTPEMLHPHPQYFLLPKNGTPSQYLSCLLSYFLY